MLQCSTTTYIDYNIYSTTYRESTDELPSVPFKVIGAGRGDIFSQSQTPVARQRQNGR